MPGGNGTGPMGMGPMTGRAAGFCAGFPMQGSMNQGNGRCLGMGRGGGHGRRNWFHATGLPGWMRAGTSYSDAPTKQQELAILKGQAGQFEAALGDIHKRLQELESQPAEK